MRADIDAILKNERDKSVDKRGDLWVIRVGKQAGARTDGPGLARDLLRREIKRREEADEPVPVEIPMFLAEPVTEPEAPDKRDARIAELEAKLAEKDAVIDAAVNTPPSDVAETLQEVGLYNGTIEQIDSEMTVLYARYMGYAQYASKNTVYDGQGEVYWTRKAERYLRVRDWNRGRMVEKI